MVTASAVNELRNMTGFITPKTTFTERTASSLPGTTKSTSSGSQFVSTKPNTGMLSFLASLIGDLSKKTVAELREMAKEAEVSGASSMKKEELIEALNK